MNPELLIERFPRLYHMAEDGSWPSIKKNGLLSTSRLLDLYDVRGRERAALEQRHRPESVSIRQAGLPVAVVRDQKPMSDAGLQRCLQDGLAPKDWYRTLNSMCFFWLTEERLFRLLEAKPYRTLSHTVLTVDTASILFSHSKRVRLCPINSGCTKPFPHERGKDTFLPIVQYPFDDWDKKRSRKDPIVEFAVLDGVLDIAKHTIEVRRMTGRKVLK